MNISRKMKILAVALVAMFLLPGYLWLKAGQPKVDLIIFSFDRPLQLYALLESTATYVTGLGKTIVIYRSSNQNFHDAYDKVQAAFPWADFWEQGANPKADFKPLTMKALNVTSSYIVFAVDDDVIKDYVDLTECVRVLETEGAYGLYLSLGKNLTQCYGYYAQQVQPNLESVGKELFTWILGHASYDWGYPHTVDLALYRKAGVIKDFNSFFFTNPNTLEGAWAGLSGRVAQRKGLCFSESKIVNLPLNRVQNEYKNRVMNSLTPQELLELFNQGFKLDIQPLFKIKNLDVHMEYVPTFVAM